MKHLVFLLVVFGVGTLGTVVAEDLSYQKLDYAVFAAGPHQVRLLEGQYNVVFSMYGAAGDLEKIQQLKTVMCEQGLGNGFDPGPGPYPDSKPVMDYLASINWPLVCYPGADMQIKGGRGVLGSVNEAVFEKMDAAGVFTAIQLGEWGYYFHNLSCNESWWKGNFGDQYDQYKHLMKPAGLKGYDHKPTSKQECYEIVKEYYLSRKKDLLDRIISVTGHSHYESYAGEWGTKCIGLELGENIAFTQSKLAFARGASKQWETPWSVQVSPWFGPSCTASGPVRIENGITRGLDAGHSLSFYERMWSHAWFSGAVLITPENSIAIFFEKPEAPWTLTSHGEKAREVFAFMQTHDHGVPYMPVAIVMDHLAGYNGYMDKPWGILEPTAGDREVRDLFDYQLFPESDHIHGNPFPESPESSYLRPTPYGEIFDVLLTTVKPELLAAYPVILLAGDIEFDDVFVDTLHKALHSGSQVLISNRHRELLGAKYEELAKQGTIEILEPWINPVTQRTTAISNQRLMKLCRNLLPVTVSGDDIQYQINRNKRGWVLELVNNDGVKKFRDKPAEIDETAIAHVKIEHDLNCDAILEWRLGKIYPNSGTLEIEVGPGNSAFLVFVLHRDSHIGGK